MNTKRNALQALLACALAGLALPAAADASDDWVAYRRANALAVEVQPSLPGQVVNAAALPDFVGEASNTWVYYRRAGNLPVDPRPSAPGEGVLDPTTPAWLGEASNTWVAYRRSHNLPVDWTLAQK